MRIISENTINIDHVMYQPLGRCQKNCPGCYARHAATDSPIDISQFLNLIYSSNESIIKPGQLTISLDDVSNSPQYSKLRENLKVLWGDVYEYKKQLHLPELCITCNTANEINDWCERLRLSWKEFLGPITLLSLSECNTFINHWPDVPVASPLDKEEIRRETNTTLGCNLLVRLEEAVSRGHAHSFDHIYLLLYKSPLGMITNKQAVKHWLETFISLTGQDIKPCKVIPDACITESWRYLKQGLSCSAGIHKVCQWANGACSGCPYDSSGAHHKFLGTSVNPDIFQEMKEATNSVGIERHPIKLCTIPTALKQVLEEEPDLFKQCQEKGLFL